jgi:hypothetical protein
LHLLDKKRAEEGVLVVLDSGHSDRALGTKGLNRNASEVSGKKEKEGERGGERGREGTMPRNERPGSTGGAMGAHWGHVVVHGVTSREGGAASGGQTDG